MLLTRKPYHLLLVLAVLLAVVSLAGANNSKTVDVHLRDTYYVLDIVFIMRAITMLLLLLWLLYIFTFESLFSVGLAWMHICLTLTLSLTISGLLLWKANNYVVSVDIMHINVRRTTLVVQIFIALMLLTQLIYFINLLAGILKRVN
ncbi:MAG: hypothetical protein J0I84_14800 [Terrimonas sp.]|nr:hypothetical protein [Terrimonas sp.]OJY92830.1 MAG: hypothetical protein BGP13_20760 [Sphingobacteriales bacterium 40-81]